MSVHKDDPTVHFYDTERMNELRFELSKLGNTTFTDDSGTPQDAIAELRRGINDLSARAQQLSAKENWDEAEKMLRAAETAGSVISRWQRDEKNNQLAARMNDKASSSDIKLLQPSESFAKHALYNSPPQKHGIGDLLAGMVGARQDGEIKAALSEGIDSAGGLSVPTYLLDNVIDAMRSQMVTMRAGAQTIRLETDLTKMLRIQGDPTAQWHAENDLITDSQPTFDALEFKPCTLVTLVKCSRELLADGANINTAVELAISSAMSQAMDKAMIWGDGQNNSPLGLVNHSGLANVDVGGAFKDFSKPLEAVLKLRQNNVWSDTPLHMLLNPLGWSQLQGLVSNEGQPLQPPMAIAEIPQLVSTAVPAAQAVVGDFNKLIVGIRDQLRIELLRETFADRYQVAFLASMRVCVGVMHPSAFCTLSGISAPATTKAK
jgi:HK97 family phage major capsid protein